MKHSSVIAAVAIALLVPTESTFAKPLHEVAIATSRSTCPGPADHTEIWTADDLRRITDDMLENNASTLRYRQCADIELPSSGSYPIGLHPDGQVAVGGFRGVYLGQGHRILGLRPVANHSSAFGLFLRLDGAHISQLEITNAQYVGDQRAGVLAAEVHQSALENIIIRASAVRTSNLDGGVLAGTITNSTLRDFTIEARAGTLGGLARSISNSTLEDMHVHIVRDENSNFLKFAGVTDSFFESQAQRVRIRLDAEHSLNLEEIAGFALESTRSHLTSIIVSNSLFPHTTSRAAGLVVKALTGTVIEEAKVTTNLSAAWQAGGLVARSEGATFRDSLFIGEIQSNWAAGGIIGSGSPGVDSMGSSPTSIERCAVRQSAISGRGPVGGIVGELSSFATAEGSVTDSYALTSVRSYMSANEYTNLGGIAGLAYGSMIDRVVFSGPVGDAEYIGGITGVPFLDSVVQSAFYNSDLLSFNNGEGTPATQSRMMQDLSLYADFDLAQVWSFTTGDFPELRSIRNFRLDTNNDFVITLQDFFAFLALYFSSSPQADFLTDGTINSSDIFAYLSAWFGV